MGSDQGLCDRATGLCSCFPGYTGSSCQRTTCPDDCSGHGTCRSNRDFAYDWAVAKTTQIQNDKTDHTELFKETYFASYDDAWDSDMHYGCLCDQGYRGPSCALVEPPRRTIPLMISATALTARSLLTSSCNTMRLSATPVGSKLTQLDCRPIQLASKLTCRTVNTTPGTFWTTMAARFTVATVQCLARTVLVVVSAITPVAHASASVDTPALHVRRWKRCLKLRAFGR